MHPEAQLSGKGVDQTDHHWCIEKKQIELREERRESRPGHQCPAGDACCWYQSDKQADRITDIRRILPQK